MQHLGGANKQQGEGTKLRGVPGMPPNRSFMVTVSKGNPLTETVFKVSRAEPLKLAERIWAGEFVDFCELPPAKGRARPVTGSMEGQLILVQAAYLYQTKKLIPDLATWSQCFALFTANIAVKQPKRIPDLPTYMATIAKASQKYRWSSWLVYDQNFRQQAAESGNFDWSKIDPSIYAQCFNGMAGADTATLSSTLQKTAPHGSGWTRV